VVNNLTVSTYNTGSNSTIALHFAATPAVLFVALEYTVLLGLLSSVLPCVRAARMEVAAGLAGDCI